ncbi:hypothetical protein DFH09DRAFT_1277873 [Mycena vulgaris]|nr:hypothetical protein DFH09DRAFT_1277873 [Mycena vulgaris]
MSLGWIRHHARPLKCPAPRRAAPPKFLQPPPLPLYFSFLTPLYARAPTPPTSAPPPSTAERRSNHLVHNHIVFVLYLFVWLVVAYRVRGQTLVREGGEGRREERVTGGGIRAGREGREEEEKGARKMKRGGADGVMTCPPRREGKGEGGRGAQGGPRKGGQGERVGRGRKARVVVVGVRRREKKGRGVAGPRGGMDKRRKGKGRGGGGEGEARVLVMTSPPATGREETGSAVGCRRGGEDDGRGRLRAGARVGRAPRQRDTTESEGGETPGSGMRGGRTGTIRERAGVTDKGTKTITQRGRVPRRQGTADVGRRGGGRTRCLDAGAGCEGGLGAADGACTGERGRGRRRRWWWWEGLPREAQRQPRGGRFGARLGCALLRNLHLDGLRAEGQRKASTGSDGGAHDGEDEDRGEEGERDGGGHARGKAEAGRGGGEGGGRMNIVSR